MDLCAFTAPGLRASAGPAPLITAMALRLGQGAGARALRTGPFFIVVEGALRTGPFFIVVEAWMHAQDRQELGALQSLLLVHGLTSMSFECAGPHDLQGCAQFAAGLAASQEGFLIGIGSDALALELARAAWTRACPLGLLARGGRRQLAQQHGLPQDLPGAVAAWQARLASPVPVGLLNGAPFFTRAQLQPARPPASWFERLLSPERADGSEVHAPSEPTHDHLPTPATPRPGHEPARMRVRMNQTQEYPVVQSLQVWARQPSAALPDHSLCAELQPLGAAALTLGLHSAISQPEPPGEARLTLQADQQEPLLASHAILQRAETPLLLMRGC